jgi:hypothetical protein
VSHIRISENYYFFKVKEVICDVCLNIFKNIQNLISQKRIVHIKVNTIIFDCYFMSDHN